MKKLLSLSLLLLGFMLTGKANAFVKNDTTTVLFLGDSITAGLGVGENNAYPAIIQHKVDSLGWNVDVINAGLSGETSAGGLRRVNWLIRQWRRIDVMVLELGANDGLRGIDPKSTKKNLQEIIDTVKAKNPGVRIILAGMQVPPNLGQQYTTEFKDIYPELAKTDHTLLIPFLLQGVGGVPSLNQGDGIHPNIKGHKIVAQNVWEVLKPVLEELRIKNKNR
ncbi:MAG TPA: arylesterase [Balneolales bacterium]|jgi:acyl-CoA thioesterase-1|nr:arylesterase [Balneolales bacterium]